MHDEQVFRWVIVGMIAAFPLILLVLSRLYVRRLSGELEEIAKPYKQKKEDTDA